MKRLALTALSAAVAFTLTHAQEWMHVHRRWADVPWSVPMRIDQTQQAEFADDGRLMHTVVADGEGKTIAVPFGTESIDSITFANDLTDDEKGHNKYRVFPMYITTLDNQPVVKREQWIDCHISIDGRGEYSDYSGMGRMRGRGNSSWSWYEKKPYKFKLDTKNKLLGLDKARNWNLLANYRDVTDLMNAFAFEAARHMGMPHTNHTRFVELFLNGEYVGIYQLTEKLEVGKNRVDIDEEGGVLLSFDKDDGPELSPDATDNFFSQVFGLPMCIKHPEDPTAEKVAEVKADFAELERAIMAKDFAAMDRLMDVESFIHILQLHEFLYNVEIDAPRSLYMFRDKGGKYVFGPVWDWDAGYDFDWGNMMTGHTFFTDHRELIFGTKPATHAGAAYHINPFWTTMFADETFVALYKKLWNKVSGTMLDHVWSEMEKYVEGMNEGAIHREFERWPIASPTGWWGAPEPMTAAEETAKMRTWLERRLAYLDKVVANYPEGTSNPGDDTPAYTYQVDKENNTIHITCPVDATMGYSQGFRLLIEESDVVDCLGGNPTSLTALNTNGSKGRNTAAGTYGAWFDANGDTNNWAVGHVYIESNELYSWAFGCHPDNCEAGDTHTVAMQYAYKKKTMNVVVTFIVE